MWSAVALASSTMPVESDLQIRITSIFYEVSAFPEVKSRPEMIALTADPFKFILDRDYIHRTRSLKSPCRKSLKESVDEIRVGGFDIRQRLLR